MNELYMNSLSKDQYARLFIENISLEVSSVATEVVTIFGKAGSL